VNDLLGRIEPGTTVSAKGHNHALSSSSWLRKNSSGRQCPRLLRAFCSGVLGLTAGCRRVFSIGNALELRGPLFDTFVGYESESDFFPRRPNFL
jgi:hypothetical protein